MKVITRAAAKAAGLKFYFTGLPCKRGNIAPRKVGNKTCTCIGCSETPERIRERARDWHRRNRDAKLAANRKYYAENKAKFISYNVKRRAAESRAMPAWFGEFDEFAFSEALELCRVRTTETCITWHVDHLIPLRAKIACGLHCADNIQVIPAAMNMAKKTRMVLINRLEWLR